ncbi:hypothetical protein G3I13_11855 [Streptomyces sp. SID6673]|nr:hypothetical protein [Streptomyces sp. SID11726]NEB25030.1 hypothetical protein [Streptomyces sp. SID6673]
MADRDVPAMRPPGEAVDLFGLRSLPVVGALLAYGAVYTVVTIGSGLEIRGPANWLGLATAFVLLAADLAVLIRVVGDPFPFRWGVAAVAVMIAGTATAWWSVPTDTFQTLQCLPAAVSGIVVLALLAVRGRLGLAWIGAATMSLSASLWGGFRGLGFVTGLGYTLWVYPVMIFASLFVVMLRPMADSIRTLRDRELGYAASDAASLAAAAERDRQLGRLDRQARPLLEQVADDHEFSRIEVQRARLVEAQLRDGIRAPAWDSARVRTAVWRARERGVSVVLFDDGGRNGDDSVQQRLDDALIDELEGLGGGRVTARVLPPGRATRATIVVNVDDASRRYDVTEAGEIVAGAWSRIGDGAAFG